MENKDYLIYGDDNLKEIEELTKASEGLDDIIEQKRKEIIKEKQKKKKKAKKKKGKEETQIVFAPSEGGVALTDVSLDDDSPLLNNNVISAPTEDVKEKEPKKEPEKKEEKKEKKPQKEKPKKDNKVGKTIIKVVLFIIVAALISTCAYFGYPYVKDYVEEYQKTQQTQPQPVETENPDNVVEVTPDIPNKSDITVTSGRLIPLNDTSHKEVRDMISYSATINSIIDSYVNNTLTVMKDYRDGKIEGSVEEALAKYVQMVIMDQTALQTYETPFIAANGQGYYDSAVNRYSNLYSMLIAIKDNSDIETNIQIFNSYIREGNNLSIKSREQLILFLDANNVSYEVDENGGYITYDELQFNANVPGEGEIIGDNEVGIDTNQNTEPAQTVSPDLEENTTPEPTSEPTTEPTQQPTEEVQPEPTTVPENI